MEWMVTMYQCLTLQQVSISTTHFLANEAASAVCAAGNQSVQQLASQVQVTGRQTRLKIRQCVDTEQISCSTV